ncbi:LarC family nickel insertion protein [Halomonas sp. NO4]|uniref:LarC family nickel insertion protein n=1 Tax=Halomonas sp. NO4 TaxID=2484813 RepID=UPI0013D0B760|nr:LarC family nickel insertion protein [Halomonas sp. NO4]
MQRQRLVRIDPLGGVAGDMMVAALLDAFPEHEPALADSLVCLRLPPSVSWRIDEGTFSGFRGKRFRVEAESEQAAHSHHHYSDLVELIGHCGLPQGVARRALDIYTLLADAEAAVHGTTLQQVVFHEVGAWDSVIDVVAVATLLEAIGETKWLCGSLPLGSGQVPTDHGWVPVPAPATSKLLDGMPVHDDGLGGERITPTGAAILRHLGCHFDTRCSGRLRNTGMGFGSRELPDRANALRLLVLETANNDAGFLHDRVVRVAFDIDDQTPEDVAIAVDILRDTAGVLDVTLATRASKKGRVGFHIELLAQPERFDDILAACFRQTTTLGIRYHEIERALLTREHGEATTSQGQVRIKTASRPSGATRKAEADDIARLRESQQRRQQVRREAEQAGEP